MNWFRNAKFRYKFLLAFSIPLSIVLFLAIYASIKIKNVEQEFVHLTEGPNRRLIYASDAIAELANCRRCILAMGYMSNDVEYVKICYDSYRESVKLIMRNLDDYYQNLKSDSFLEEHEIQNREKIIAEVKEMFTGAYQQKVDDLYNAVIAQHESDIDRLVSEGLPMGDEMTETLWDLRSIVQDHLKNISEQAQQYANNAVATLVVIAIGLVVLSVAVTTRMSNVLRIPIEQMEVGMREIENGNLQYPIRSKYKDELGVLSNRIGDMVDKISMLNKAVVIVDSVDEFILVTDLQYNILFVNHKLEELYNLDRTECLGKKCYKAIYGLEEPCGFCTLPQLLENKSSFSTNHWQRQDTTTGKEISIAGRTSIVRWVDGSFAQISTGKDDTLRVKHEEQQRKHAEELREAVFAAKEASKAKSVFLANMSHEIRTPMNAVMGLTELILRAKKDLSAEVYSNAVAIKGASQNLLSIINDILDLSKIESDKLEIVEANYEFSSLIHDLISIVRVRLSEKPILFIVELDPNTPEYLIGDEARIRQALLNILTNAVKYTSEGFVALKVNCEINDEKTEVILTIDVSDSGIGLKDEHIDRLFDEFVRVDSERNRTVEGTGLGLPISLKLCQAMGGNIAVTSEYEKGSTFTVTLPQKIPKYEPVASVEDVQDKSVLLYEPIKMLCDSIAHALSDLNIRYEIADDEAELLKAAPEFDYAFVDVKGDPAMLTRLKRTEKPPNIVVLTAFVDAPAHKSERVIDFPAYTLPIANILNDRNGGGFDLAVANETFTAPEASVLIVDDMQSNLLVAKGLMAPYEMDITIVMSGEEAVAMVEENKFDLIFMDHMMPKMDGIEATKLIRALPDPKASKTPIVALTANAISGMREMFIENGMNDFLAKPIETAKLNAILEKWIPENKRIALTEPKESEYIAESELLLALRAIPELTIDKALTAMGGSCGTYEDVFKLSVRLLPNNVNRLNEFIRDDLKSYEIEVHGVKGVLNNIGAYEIGKAALELEQLSKQGDAKTCKALHPGFIRRLCAFIDKTTAVIGKPDDSEKATGELSRFKEGVESIAAAIEFYNATDAIDALDPLLEFTYSPAIDKAANDLKYALESFDFDLAEESLNNLKGALEAHG